jgi:hypothetical protein
MRIMKLKGLNAISVQQNRGEKIFIASSTGFVISIPTLANLILDLLKLGFMRPEVLEGILEEYYTD